MTELTVVVGGQFGSEGKGAVVGHLARELPDDGLVVRVAGPNAGHTVMDGAEVFKFRQIPVASVTSQCMLAIAAGSEIDMQVLADELISLEKSGRSVGRRLWIHPSATLMHPLDQKRERAAGLVDKIGSTGKGIGSARSRRAMRKAEIVGPGGERLLEFLDSTGVTDLPTIGAPAWRNSPKMIIEGTQGYGLGLHTRYYPKVTSSDCRAIDFLSMAGISPWDYDVSSFRVWVVMRTYPIRVAGDSGELVGETTWGALGIPTERTTVTNKVRRVGMWDSGLARAAILANGGPPTVKIALTMLDHKFPEVSGIPSLDKLTHFPRAMKFIDKTEEDSGAEVGLVGTGPSTLVEMH